MSPKGLFYAIIISCVLWLIIIGAIVIMAGCQQSVITSAEGQFYFTPAGIQIQTTNYGIITTKYKGAWLSESMLTEYIKLKEKELSK